MKATAIICEYNPLTNGHASHIERAKAETDADTLVAIMSGSFTQRGDAAIADKYLRASVAVRLGIDVVIELPTTYAVAPADDFAFGAMKIIKSIPSVTCVSFGSECGDIEVLKRTADLLDNEPIAVSEKIKAFLADGDSYPKARAQAIDAYAEENPDFSFAKGVLDGPNNVLGIAYISAAKKLNMDIGFHTIKRMGGEYNDDDLSSPYPSASAIRKAIKTGKINDIKNSVPIFTYNLLTTFDYSGASLGDLMLFRIKELSSTALASYCEITGGLHNRLKYAAEGVHTYEQFLENAKTKKYTMAKIKRISLCALLGATKELCELAKSSDPYIFILAINKLRKAEILADFNETCPNVLIRYSDIDKVDKTLRPLIKLDFKAQGVLGIVNRSNYYNKSMLLI